MKKSVLVAAVATMVMAVPSVAAAHGGPPVVNFTDTTAVSVAVPFAGPCTPPGIVSIDYHETLHVTEFADGHFVAKFNQAGAFEFDPVDPGEPSSTGHYRNGNITVATQNTFTSTSNFIVRGTNELGERTSFKIHTALVVVDGVPRVDVVSIECG